MKIEYVPGSNLIPEMRVELEVLEGDWPGVYVSRIASVAGRDIALEAPISSGITVPLRPDTPVLVRAGSANGLLSFDSTVRDRRAGSRPLILVDRPQRLMLVQRRDAVRVLTRLPVRFDRADPLRLTDARPQAGVALNLSGGGGALRCALPLNSGERLRLRLPLSDGSDLLVASEVLAMETRRARFDTERIARLRFDGLSAREENQLFRLIRTLEQNRLRQRRDARDAY